MKITGVQTTPVAVPLTAPREHALGETSWIDRTVLQITTDDGLTGLGEVGNRVPGERLNQMVPAVVGMDPFNLEVVRERLLGRGYWDRVAAMVLAGLEMACLDVQGKAVGRPVHHLLGGPVRTAVPMTAPVFRTRGGADRRAISTPDELVGLAKKLVAGLGVTTLKLKTGNHDWKDDVAALEALRTSFPESQLRVDANAAWTVRTALRFIDATRAIGLEWVEDPVRGADAMREVRSRSSTPLATNMCLTTLEELAGAQGSTDVVLVDLWFVGGFVRAQAFARALEAHGIEVAVHSGGGGTTELGIGQAANLHLAASLPRLTVAVDGVHHDHADDIIRSGPFACVDGSMAIPEGEGLGVELDDDRVRRFAAARRDLVADGAVPVRRYE